MNTNKNLGTIIGSVSSLEFLETSETAEFKKSNISMAVLRIKPFEGEGKIVLCLTQKEFSATTRWWWDGTKECAKRLNKKLKGRFFSSELGID